jgi:hypothetical protein
MKNVISAPPLNPPGKEARKWRNPRKSIDRRPQRVLMEKRCPNRRCGRFKKQLKVRCTLRAERDEYEFHNQRR